jgi:hypothetical protein
MNLTRKERIERAALAQWLDGLDIKDAIIGAKAFIDTIDALTAPEPSTDRAPDTTTPLKPGDEVLVIGLTTAGYGGHQFKKAVFNEVDGDGDCVVTVGGGTSYFPRSSLDGPLNRKPDHIPDAGKKVELPGKWTADGEKVGNAAIGFFAARTKLEADCIATQRNADVDAAYMAGKNDSINQNVRAVVGKWRSIGSDVYYASDDYHKAVSHFDAERIVTQHNIERADIFKSAFRAGVEAAAGLLPDNSVNPEIVRKMLAIQPPKID